VAAWSGAARGVAPVSDLGSAILFAVEQRRRAGRRRPIGMPGLELSTVRAGVLAERPRGPRPLNLPPDDNTSVGSWGISGHARSPFVLRVGRVPGGWRQSASVPSRSTVSVGLSRPPTSRYPVMQFLHLVSPFRPGTCPSCPCAAGRFGRGADRMPVKTGRPKKKPEE